MLDRSVVGLCVLDKFDDLIELGVMVGFGDVNIDMFMVVDGFIDYVVVFGFLYRYCFVGDYVFVNIGFIFD